MTRQEIRKLEDEGDISPRQVQRFYIAVREFYTMATTYALQWLPLNDPLLQNAQFVNFKSRASATIY